MVITEKKKAYSKAWRIKNAEKIKTYRKAYHQENAEKAKAYYQENSEKLITQSKAWIEANPENYKKSQTIKNWKRRGLICDDYDLLNEAYLQSTNFIE